MWIKEAFVENTALCSFMHGVLESSNPSVTNKRDMKALMLMVKWWCCSGGWRLWPPGPPAWLHLRVQDAAQTDPEAGGTCHGTTQSSPVGWQKLLFYSLILGLGFGGWGVLFLVHVVKLLFWGQNVTLPSKITHIDTFHEILIFTHL